MRSVINSFKAMCHMYGTMFAVTGVVFTIAIPVSVIGLVWSVVVFFNDYNPVGLATWSAACVATLLGNLAGIRYMRDN